MGKCSAVQGWPFAFVRANAANTHQQGASEGIRVFSRGDEFNIIGIQVVYRQVIGYVVDVDYKEDRT